ncbi:BnaC06g02590D [Brassica napus]|uniref:BnaC06g02590D protein n=1 Tax=Brassica napus TaxID=3708 RepID=A0A078GTW9_BRANA|nr:BnaC06g02590D [Brassica napus]
MGACGSSESRRTDTAKLILPDGALHEFTSPVKVWQIFQKNPTSFVCNSDDMDFDDAVIAVGGSEDLRPGELYFVLPLTWLKYPLRAEQMAALAVKGSSALTKSGWSCGDDGDARKVSGGDVNGNCSRVKRVKRNSCGGRGCGSGGKGRRKFTVELSSIAE